MPGAHDALVVRQGIAYFWNGTDHCLMEGSVGQFALSLGDHCIATDQDDLSSVDDCFHWRKIETSGPIPLFRGYFTFDDGLFFKVKRVANGEYSHIQLF